LFFQKQETFNLFKTANEFDLSFFFKDLDYNKVIFLENFDREYLLKVLQQVNLKCPDFTEFTNVFSHYLIFISGFDKYYSYFFF